MVKLIQKYPSYALLIVFGLVYAISLTFTFIEGDDAFTVAYHAYGRNLDYQGPYSPYHGMMDVFFSIFPASTSLLKVVAIGISAVAACVFVLLVFRLLKKWLPEEISGNLVFFIPLLPFIVPELFFFGLIYMPSIVAISFMLGGHLLIRKQFELGKINPLAFVLALMLFGVGAACRWDTAVYGIVIFSDILVLLINTKSLRINKILPLVLWCILAISSVLVFIYISGYSPIEIKETIMWAKQYLSAKPPSMLKKAALVISLLTPAFLICFLLGLFRIVMEQRWGLFLIGIAGYLPKLYLGLTLLPKAMVMALPGFFLITYLGFDFILKLKRPQFTIKGKILEVFPILLYVTIFIPWVVGIHIDAKNTSWGPGFEVSYKPLDQNASKKSLDQKINLGAIKPAFSGGFAVPTPEGPRPVWGFGGVLLGGEWRSMLTNHNHSIDAVIEYATKNQIPILQNNKYMLVMIKLLEAGLNQNALADNREKYEFRSFGPNRNNENIDVFMIRNKVLFEKVDFSHVVNEINHKKMICWFITSSDIAKLKESYPENVEVIGPFSAIIDFTE